MNANSPPRCFPLFAMLCILLIFSAALTSATLAQSNVTNRGVLKRMATMNNAKSAVETLSNMMAGRVRFDRFQARKARKRLIAITRSIPAVFKKPHSDPLSRASPNIWLDWDDFKTRANAAKQAARALNIKRLETLRSTLPEMISACLNCHQAFRNPH